MKRVRINNGKIGLVYRNGDYNRVLTAGKYWLWPFEELTLYNMSQPFEPNRDLNYYLNDEELFKLIDLVEVKDNEIALVFENGNFNKVLKSGRYAYWKGVTKFRFTIVDLNNLEIGNEIDSYLRKHPLLREYVKVLCVESFERGLLIVNNQYQRELEMGEYFFWTGNKLVTMLKTDLRQTQLELSGQELLTKDKAALRINFFATYKVVNAVVALIDNREFERQLYILLQLALREYVGSLTLDELMERKTEVSAYVLQSVKSSAAALGVEVTNGGVRDIILPGEVREIMNQVLVATKQAQANIIMRREETASTRSLLNTAKLMEENEMLFKLKEMEFVEKIAEKINTISLSGNSQIIDQLKQIFVPAK